MDAFEEQIKAIEAANAGEADELEPGAGEPQKPDAQDEPEQSEEADGSQGDALELTEDDEAVDAEEGDEAGEEEEGDDGRRRRSKPAKERIAELTAARREAERRAQAAEAELAKLRTGDNEPSKELVKPNPEDFEFGEADPKYIDAVQDYKLDVRDAERSKGEKQQQQQQAMVNRLNAGLMKAEVEGQTKYDDFDAKVTEAAKLRGEPLPPMLSIGMAVSPVGGDLIYRLATDEAVSERLETLAKGKNPRAFAMAMGELEGEYIADGDDSDLDISDEMDMARMMGRMRSRVSGKKAAAPVNAVQPTNAPEPPAKRAKGGSGKAAVKPDTDDINDFMQHFGKDLGR